LQHHEAEVIVADVGGVEQERVVVRAVEGEEHTVGGFRTSVPSVDLFSVGTAEVAHERLTGDLSHGVFTLVVGGRSGDRGITRGRDHEVAAAVAFHTDVVVHTGHGRPSNGALESSLASVAVGGDASQCAVHVLGENRDVSAGGVVCLRIVQWGVASADGDLLIGVRVEDVPHACSAQHVVSVLEALQSFTVGGVLDGACGAQTASQSFRIGHVVVGGRQLARPVVHARRRIVVDACWVGATFEAALASQGEVEAVFLTCAHSGVSSAELVGQLDAHLTWVNVIQHLEVVATRSQAHVVSTDVQAVTCECSGDGSAVFEGTRREVVEVVLRTAPSVAEAVEHVHGQDEGAWIAVNAVTWEGRVGVVVGSRAVLATDAAVVARLVVDVCVHVVVASRSVDAAELAIAEVA